MAATLASIFLGIGHHVDAGHGAAHGAHAGHAAAHGTHHGVESDQGPSPFNVQTIVAFLTFFGGIGFVMTVASQLVGPVVFAIATLAGLIGGGIVFFFLAQVLFRDQSPWMRASDYTLPGTIGRITSSIAAGGTGEIVFEKQGRRRVEAARTENGQPIARGEEVIIVSYERGIAFVEPSALLFAPAADPQRSLGTDQQR